VALAGKAEGQLYYATDLDKVYYFDGSVLKVTGGGLLTVYKAYADGDFTAEAGKHYIVDMAGAAALRTITLPTGAAEAVVRVTCINNDSTTYPLTIARDGSSTIFYNDTENTTVSFPYAEQWAEFSYTVIGTHWVVNDGSTPLSGTWSGSLDMTGTLYVDTIQEHTATKGVAIKGRTDGVEVAAGYAGEPKTAASAVAAAGTDAWYDITSQELTAGNWLILGGFKFVSNSAVGANTQTLSRITYNAGADSVIGKNSFYEDGDATKNYANFAYCYNVNFTGANRTYAIQGRWSAGAGNPLFCGHLTAIRLP
jgi:hypothetical protein